MKFTKMQGIGNDYVYVDCFKENVKNPSAAASCVDEGETKGISSYRFSSNCSTVMVA